MIIESRVFLVSMCVNMSGIDIQNDMLGLIDGIGLFNKVKQ